MPWAIATQSSLLQPTAMCTAHQDWHSPINNASPPFGFKAAPPSRPIARSWGRAIAALGGALILSACSAPVPNASTDSSDTLADSGTTALADPAPPSTEGSTPASPTTAPLRADDIRSFLEQGSIEDSSQCPSKSVGDAQSSALQKVAYFETTHYWIEICTHENGDLEYYGRKRDQPNLDLAIAAYAVGDRSQEYTAQNGNTVYQINAAELVVTQNGVPIIREPVVRSSFDETP